MSNEIRWLKFFCNKFASLQKSCLSHLFLTWILVKSKLVVNLLLSHKINYDYMRLK